MSLATEDKSCPVEGIGTLRFRVKYKGSFHETTLTDVLFNPKLRRNLLSGSRLKVKDNTESQGFSDLSEQQEALMVEVTIPNCYKQAIRSRGASKWHDAMNKEINVMKERKVWDLVDHPDNIKILENRWVYTIKYDENNKIVRYKARLVARGNTQLRDETPISWRTFKQKSVSLSTMEAKYVSLTEAAKEFIWLKNVIDNKSLNLKLSENEMFCDNQAAISFQSHR
ncbi:retrovirus-related Pol polyprotein from transposon TNT 1-94 [Trichonephila clavipes]|nr:retrovirus-related Pol polyprotein from transposon TNT 1-94 [Trichonephila clavipes]